MSWSTNLLVIAHGTADSNELLRELRSRALMGAIQVTLVAPADGGRGETAVRLKRAIARLEADDITIEGIVGHADPLATVQEVWDPRRFDEVLVVTPGAGMARATAADLAHRIERFTGAEVTRLVAFAPVVNLTPVPPQAYA
jgi:hypothetical protein